MRITDDTKSKIAELRAEGLSYAKIAKQTGVSRSSVINIIKERKQENEPIEAKVKKPCPNPRLIIIHFGEIEDDAKCIVRPGISYPRGKTLLVKKVLESEEPLYRLA